MRRFRDACAAAADSFLLCLTLALLVVAAVAYHGFGSDAPGVDEWGE